MLRSTCHYDEVDLVQCPDQPLAATQVLAFPVAMLVRFWVNHHLLDVLQRPVWRVVKGRSRTYVERILSGAPPPLPKLRARACSLQRSAWLVAAAG